MTGRFRCVVMTEFSCLERLAGEWERLFQSTGAPGGVFQSWEWTRAYWSVYGSDLRLCTPVLFEGDRVVGILPVAVRDGTARLVGAPFADYNGALCDPDAGASAIPAMLASLFAAPVPWRECLFEGVPESSPLLRSSGEQTPAWLRDRLQTAIGDPCPTVVNDGIVFDRLARKESLRRHENRLRRRGSLQFRHIEDRDEIVGRHLDRFLDMVVTRQALHGVRSLFLSDDARAMARALVCELDPGRELRFSVLELDRTPVAYHLGFEHAGKYTWYVPTFDVDLWNDGPGEVLLRHLLLYAHERQLSEFDFTIGDEEYKTRFANLVRRTFTMHVDRDPHQPIIRIRRAMRTARHAVRQSPAGIRWARRALLVGRRVARRAKIRDTTLAGAALAAASLFGRTQTVSCRGTVDDALPRDGVGASKLTLSALARLRLEHDALDDSAVQAIRRRMKEDEAYLVRVGPAKHMFWISAARVGTARPEQPRPICVAEGPAFGSTSLRTLGAAMTAVLCAVRLLSGRSGEVQIRSKHRRTAERAARRAGYVTVARTDRSPGPRGKLNPSLAR